MRIRISALSYALIILQVFTDHATWQKNTNAKEALVSKIVEQDSFLKSK